MSRRHPKARPAEPSSQHTGWPIVGEDGVSPAKDPNDSHRCVWAPSDKVPPPPPPADGATAAPSYSTTNHPADNCRLPFLYGGSRGEDFSRLHHELANRKVDDAMLNQFRKEGDPLADAALDALLEDNVPVYSLMHLDVGVNMAEQMERTGFVTPSALKAMRKKKERDAAEADRTGEHPKMNETLAEAVLRLYRSGEKRATALINAMDESPEEWMKSHGGMKKVAHHGRAIFNRNWFAAGLVLGLRALFLAYLIPDGMEVLKNYGSSLHGPNDFHRLFHTAFWVHQLMDMTEDPFQRDSKAYRAILHVRLMHSAIRKRLLTHGVLKHRDDTNVKQRKFALLKEEEERVPWDTKAHGIPINQEDMAGTTFLFSILVLDGLTMMGVTLDRYEAECYYLYWRWVGSRLGVDMTALPHSMFDASLVAHRIGERCYGVNPSLLEFTDSLVSQTTTIYPLSKPIVSALVHRLCGPEIVRDAKLVPPSTFGHILFSIMACVFWWIDFSQRWIPGVFWFLYGIKRPLMRMSLFKARSYSEQANQVDEDGNPLPRRSGCPFNFG